MKISELQNVKINNWQDISSFLYSISKSNPKLKIHDFNKLPANGIAFITYNYGIDGVSIEISKYARCFERTFSSQESELIPIHLISGGFLEHSDSIIKSRWRKFEIPNFDGWDKWDKGKWFAKLFYEDMPENSEISNSLAKEIWKQATKFAKYISNYIAELDIKLIIPVNVCSNPGNLASTLAITIASELTGVYVLNSNHDFYWEGGKPSNEKEPGEPPGCRDHFFRNFDNKPFFNLFKSILPWNGENWFQLNINKRQSDKLVSKFGFSAERVGEIGTSVPETFFDDLSPEAVKIKRFAMTYIFSDGKPVISASQIDDFSNSLSDWMKNQKPAVCSIKNNSNLSLAFDNLIYFLQPTRVIGRKRIVKDCELIAALANFQNFKNNLKENSKIFLHITGPVPIEHQADLEELLAAYKKSAKEILEKNNIEFLIGFSVGNEKHPELKKTGLRNLHIWDFYHIADIVLFPSEEEGRGLPLVESAATGTPIVSSRYYPENVFKEVVGEDLEKKYQIKYILFPENEYSDASLAEITKLLFDDNEKIALAKHNKNAASLRYGTEALAKHFTDALQKLTVQ